MSALAEGLARIHHDHKYDRVSPLEFDFNYNGDKPKNQNRQYIPVYLIFRKWWLLRLPSLLRIYKADVFHGANYCVPVFAPCPTAENRGDNIFALAQNRRADRALP